MGGKKEIDVLNYGKVDPATIAKMASKGDKQPSKNNGKLKELPRSAILALRGTQVMSSFFFFLVAFDFWDVNNDAITGAMLMACIVFPPVATFYITTIKYN